MKFFLYFFAMAGAGYLGYTLEPGLRLQLTGNAVATMGAAGSGSAVERMPDGAIKINLASLTPEQLPQRVLLKADAKVADSSSGVDMLIKAGNRVRLIGIEGENVVISPGEGPSRGTVLITDTDILQQIAANPPAPANLPATPPGGDSEEPKMNPAPPPIPEPAPAPVPVPEAPTTPEAAPTPPVEPTPAPPAPAPAATGSSDVVSVMQASIKAAQIKEFTFDQVLEWTATPDETVDGELFQTGVASYKAETIFGVKTIQAKALVKGGTVQRWIWPKSGMDIK
jgi:hypothetical protein